VLVAFAESRDASEWLGNIGVVARGYGDEASGRRIQPDTMDPCVPARGCLARREVEQEVQNVVAQSAGASAGSSRA